MTAAARKTHRSPHSNHTVLPPPASGHTPHFATSACLEAAETPATSLAVRDSKNPAGPHLTFAPAAFTTFIGWTRNATTAAE